MVDLCDNCFFFFFFQAEDGIRDADVTGVQTCALPICIDIDNAKEVIKMYKDFSSEMKMDAEKTRGILKESQKILENYKQKCIQRSEERRVGKECRYRW